MTMLPPYLQALKRNTSPVFVIAEIGLNHNGSMELAYQTIDAAVEAGVDAVKFQNYRTEDFIHDKSLTHSYINDGKSVCESQYTMFKRCELTFTMLEQLKEYCQKKKVCFLSTPTSKQGIDDLCTLEVPLLKNGSDYLGHYELVEAMAQTGLPLILSTGMATLSDMDDAVRTFERAGGKDLIICHCTSSYPTPDSDVCLNKIPALEKAFAHPVGFSDHSFGYTAAMGAMMLGAVLVEKHFTLDKNLAGPDHRFSADPLEMQTLCEQLLRLGTQLGTSKLGPTLEELDALKIMKLSCALSEKVQAGDTIAEKDICFQRPGSGLPPRMKENLVGKTFKKDLPKGHQIQLDEIE